MSATTDLLKEIGARISKGENKKHFILLYKGVDKVNVEDFNVKCDAKGPTVTILYGKHNTLFGGYTSQDWSSNKKRTKKDENAFLFYKHDSVNAECTFLPVIEEKADRAITCDANFGPTFGGGIFPWQDYDLQAFKKDKKPEYECKNGYLDLNGSLNVPCAYDVDGRSQKRFSRKGVTSTKHSAANEHLPFERNGNVKAKAKDINSGTMLVKRIKVYQVIDDELPTPWKTILQEDDCCRYRNELIKMEPLPGLDIKHYNILLIGVTCSGKSSFLNTLASVFFGRIIQRAAANNGRSVVTNQLTAYDLVSDQGETLKLRIFDIRGFEEDRGYDHELELILDGKLKSGYQFPDKPVPLTEKQLTPATMNDKIHLVCFVCGFSNFEVHTSKLRTRFEAVTNTVAKKGLPMVVVATKFDVMCPDISEKIDHLYKCTKAEFAVRQISDIFGIPAKHIYPVVNYDYDIELSIGKDRLALQAIYGMIQLTEAYFKKHEAMAEIVDRWVERDKMLPSLRHANDKEITLMQLHQDMLEVGDRKLRVLVTGPTNSGKSSFIDSVLSALRDEIITKAVGGLSSSTAPVGVSSTEKFQMYPIKYKHESGRIESSKVYFGDTPGFQEEGGITAEHVKYILKGHVPNKYEVVDIYRDKLLVIRSIPKSVNRDAFKKWIDILKLCISHHGKYFEDGIEKTSRGFKSRPPKADKIHCVCFVFDCKTVTERLSDDSKINTTMLKVINIVSKEGIPFIVILTKGDEDNKAVTAAKRRVFESKCEKDCKEKLIKIFKFRQNIIFPVVNYVNEDAVDLQTDALLIAAFGKILKMGKEYLEDSDDEEDDDDCGDRQFYESEDSVPGSKVPR